MEIDRRRFLEMTVATAVGSVILAACGEKNEEKPTSKSTPPVQAETINGPREVVSYPENSSPSKDIMRGAVDFQKEKTPIRILRLDEKLSNLIGEHVKKIMRAGYADNLDDKDFFHGHFHTTDPEVCKYTQDYGPVDPFGGMGRKPVDNFPAGMKYEDWVAKFLNSSPNFVYHTREKIVGNKPILEKMPNGSTRVSDPDTDYTGPPRSIIGTTDTQVFPMRSETTLYKKYGSISGMEMFDYSDKSSQGMCETQPNKTIISEGNEKYYGSQMFFIIPDTTGRYTLDNGLKYDIYLQLIK